jgi:hypothetical protein
VAEYYLRLLDRRGRVARRIDLLECLDDEHARGVAVAYPHQARMELWQGERLVEAYDNRNSEQSAALP